MTKTHIDRLGERLKAGEFSDDDLRMLDEYRLQFGPAHEVVVAALRSEFGLEPTGRPAKSTQSIVDKLRRETIRLSQIQDIAGCRVVVDDIIEQNRVLRLLMERFHEAALIDRRSKPSNGYRAVHIVVGIDGRLVEIQLRTRLQHLWSELSEKMSDLVDPGLKYGVGEAEDLELLNSAAELVSKIEDLELDYADGDVTEDVRGGLRAAREHLTEFLVESIADVPELDEER